MRYLSLLLCALLLAACNGQVRLDTPSIPDLTESVVALVNEDGHAFCTGALIEQGVLTAAHCVDDETEVLIGLLPDYSARPSEDVWTRSYRVPVLRVDAETDLALLGFNDELHAVIGVENPRVGDPVTAVGHPMGIAYTVHQGHVSGHLRHGYTRDFMLTDVGLIGGMSGGPVFNSHGHLVGVVSFAFCENMFVCTGTLGGFIPVETVLEFLS